MEPPAEFPFPFVAYEIQKDFMKNLYQAIENEKIGIFESPTGTGKSMSIICGTLTWLRDYEKLRLEELKKQASLQPTLAESEECDWISEFICKQDTANEKLKAQNILTKLNHRKEKLKKVVENSKVNAIEPDKKRIKHSHNYKGKDETLLLMEQAKREISNMENNSSDSSEDVGDLDLLPDIYYSDDESDSSSQYRYDDDEDESEDEIVKVYYCSRTHSQLTQFINEVQKSPFNKLMDNEFLVTVATLASRQSLCINDSVRKLTSVQHMNDKCLDLQKSRKETKPEDEEKHKKMKKSSCPFKKMNSVDNLSDKILGKIQDIEELVSHGKEVTACPYYAARQAATTAQLIVVPYQNLIHRATRKASGIKLKNSVVIIDEAHNLVDTIGNIHSVEVTYSQVEKARSQLTQYVGKYSKRLKAENMMYIKNLLFILRKLLMIMGSEEKKSEVDSDKHSKNSSTETIVMKVNDFLYKSRLDNLNLFKVLRYCKRSLISRKLNGFVERYFVPDTTKKSEKSSLSTFLAKGNETDPVQPPSITTEAKTQPVMRSPLIHIESFLSSLTFPNDDGRIAVTTITKDSSVAAAKLKSPASIKFLLLNPANLFRDVVEECRAVIVAGGTMQPSSSFVNQLLTPLGVPKKRIHEFSCGHVIGADHLLPLVLTQGPSRTEFEFTFDKRNNVKLIDELGRSVCNLCNIIPGGIVCFFSSYEYENTVHSRWSGTGILDKIQTKKKIFRESRRTGHVDRVLQEYTASIERTKSMKAGLTGALLLSVVGGKMSEGINFSDDLGRCIIMVGLPYPSKYSAELKEKIAYLDRNMPSVGSKSAGQSYYENLCMKAVNQSIGRAIRHRNDYASIVLIDKRYKGPDIQSQLPRWISDKLRPTAGFGQAFGAIRQFFIAKRSNN